MPSQQFPVSKKLTHASEFDAVFKQADIRVSRPELLFLVRHNDCGFNRLGMVISKKNVPTAVARNKVKRKIRECFRRQSRIGEHGVDIVVLARRPVTSDLNLFNTVDSSFRKIQREALVDKAC